MSIQSNAGAESAANEIGAYIAELKEGILREGLELGGEQLEAKVTAIVLQCVVAALDKVKAKCDSISAVAESGWY